MVPMLIHRPIWGGMRLNPKPAVQGERPSPTRARREVRALLPAQPPVSFLLEHLIRDWTARFEKQLRKKGVTHDQWRVLQVTAQTESMNIMELRDATLVPHSTLGRWLHRLEELGLVTLRTDPKDQRSVAVSIAPEGRMLYETLLPIAEECEQEALGGFSPEEERQLRDYIRRITSNLKD
jgi:DNA-binding MarR family transcriptional regulator